MIAAHASPKPTNLYCRTARKTPPRSTQPPCIAEFRMLCDWLVVSQDPPERTQPRLVRRPEARRVLPPAAARQPLDRIDPDTLAGFRDRALLSVMLYRTGEDAEWAAVDAAGGCWS